LAPSDAIRARLQEAWAGTPTNKRQLALHHLDGVGRKQWTIEYQLEGMLYFFGAWLATHLLHRYYPETVFPVDADQNYGWFRRMPRTLGIAYEEDDDQTAVYTALTISDAIEEYRTRFKLDFWQMWALVYDLAPRLLPQPTPYPTDPPPRVW